MADIRIKILVFVKQEYLLSDIVRSGMCRSSAFVAMGKGCFSTFTICFDESVDSTSCDPSSIAALSLLPLVSTSFLITSYFFCSFPMRFFDSFRFGRLTSFLGTTFVPQFSRRFVSEALPALLNGYTCRSDAVEICCRNRNTRTAGFGVSSYFRRSCPDAGDKGRGSDHGLSAGP